MQTLTQQSTLPPEAGSTLFSQQTVTISKAEHIQLKWEASYWKSQHEQSQKRLAALEKELEAERAKNRDLTQRLYGKKSEKSSGKDSGKTGSGTMPKKKRGHQPGAQGHGRTKRPDLPVKEEERDLAEAEKCCPECGEAFQPFPGTEDSDILEIEVRPHIRRIKRKRYQKTCQCSETAGIITAPPAPRLIPKSAVGISIWCEVLLDKYLHARPLERTCAAFRQHGLPLAKGTLTDGLQRIMPLFRPVVDAFYAQQMTEKLFHNDETRWEVYEAIEGKNGHRWYLWVTRSEAVILYRVSPTRGAETPKIHFAGCVEMEIIVVCDRYSAYKSLARAELGVILAFCWAHVRRDFLDAARSYPELQARMDVWVEDIRELYHLNETRLQAWDATQELTEQAAEFYEPHHALSSKLDAMKSRGEEHLAIKDLHYAERKVLQSLQNHWEGLTVFLDRPGVPMDNNTAERAIRGPVTGRKNYYGSGSVWSAELAAMMFSIFQTLMLWKLNPHHWLYTFLQACAENGGNTPADLAPFLPWTMTEERQTALSRPLPVDAIDSS